MRLAVVAAVSLVAGCASTKAEVSTIPRIDIETSFSRKDYVILGAATGQACATEECFLWSCSKKTEVLGEELFDGRMESESLRNVHTQKTDLAPWEFLFGVSNPGPTGSEIAERVAMYQAIESIPNADAIVAPRKVIDINKHDILGIATTTKSCVKVTGKAVHIKSDAEAAKKPR